MRRSGRLLAAVAEQEIDPAIQYRERKRAARVFHIIMPTPCRYLLYVLYLLDRMSEQRRFSVPAITTSYLLGIVFSYFFRWGFKQGVIVLFCTAGEDSAEVSTQRVNNRQSVTALFVLLQ